MRRSVAVLIALGLAGCSGSDASTAAPSTRPVSTPATSTSIATVPSTAAPTPPLAPDDPRPVLTLGSFDWSIPVIWRPRDLHEVAVYADGRMVRLAFRTDGGFDGSYVMTTIEPPPDAADRWIASADAAGLGTAGSRVVEPLPDGVQIVDGGYAVLTRRTGHGIGVAAVDQPSATELTGQSERRLALATLVGEMSTTAYVDQSGDPVLRWAVESALPLASLGDAPWPWPGLDPDTLDWRRNEFGVWCAVVEDADWPYAQDEAQDYESVLGGIYRRPLLPHEQSCDDVFAWRDELGYSERISPWPGGLPPQ